MKQLTDHLFEYALVSGGKEIQLEEPEKCEVVFYDLFSETDSYLVQNGFEVEFAIDWPKNNIQVCTEYIVRILDNISSNIMKYGDRKYKVIISSAIFRDSIGFQFKNVRQDMLDKTDSNGVGIPSIKNMMKKMGGKCNVHQEKETFEIEILFPFSEK